MKTQKHKLVFGKTSLIELDNGTLNSIHGGTLTDPITNTLTPNTLPDPNPFPNPFPDPFPDPFPMPIPIPGTGTLPW